MAIALVRRALVRDRKREVELRSDFRLALDPDLPAVRLDDTFGDREAEARTESGRSLCLPVGMEDLTEVLARNAGARVGHSEEHLPPIAALGAQRDHAPGGRELHPVAYQG